MMGFKDYIASVASALGRMEATDKIGYRMDSEEALSRWCSITGEGGKENSEGGKKQIADFGFK